MKLGTTLRKNLSDGFCGRDALKSECSGKNFKARGRDFTFTERF